MTISAKRTVTVVTTAFPAVSQTFVIEQLKGFDENGFQIDVVARTKDKSGASHPAVARHGLLDELSYADAPYAGRARNILLFGRQAAAALIRHPITGTRLLWRCFSETAEPRRFFHIAHPFLDRQSTDAFVCHFGQIGKDMVVIRRLLGLKGKVATFFHGADVSRLVQRFGRDMYNELFTEGDLFLPVSEHFRDILLDLGCPPDRIFVHHMGVDLNRLRFSEDYQRKTPLTMLSVARLVDKKGIEYALRAIAILRDRRPDFAIHYKIIGGGPLQDSLQQLTRELNLEKAIEFLGPQPHDIVVQSLYATDVLVAPSITADDGDKEGLTISLQEAMAMGVPIIASRHASIPELVQHETTGLMADERDSNDIAEQIERMIDADSTTVETMRRAARAHIEQEHDNEILDKVLAAHVSRIIERSSPKAT